MIDGQIMGPFWLALSKTECWKCQEATQVTALIGRDSPEEEASFLTGIESDQMPVELGQAIQAIAPYYKPIHSNTMDLTTWANACEHCQALQGAFFMHMEPDGPFFGRPEDFEGSVVDLPDLATG